MIGRRSRWAGFGVAVLAAAIAAGCSSGESDESAATAPAGGDDGVTIVTDVGPTPDVSELASAETAPVTLPSAGQPSGGDAGQVGSSEDARLLAFLYVLLEVETAEEATWTYSGNPSETAITDCMSDAGFQYAPMPSSIPERLTLPPEEYAARYGFGVAATFLGLEDRLEADPNAATKAAMSPAEQAAFDQAYRACLDTAPPENPEALLGPGGGTAMTVAIEQFRSVVDNDERVVAALTDWRACMAASGFEYENPLAMRSSFWGTITTPDDQEALEALLAEEIIVATANVPCITPYTDTYRDVIADRFFEFKTMYDTALTTGAQPGASG